MGLSVLDYSEVKVKVVIVLVQHNLDVLMFSVGK